MTLEPGSRLGPYEIVELRGKGGMGEVYRAKDTKLGREVAVKLLLDEVSRDSERYTLQRVVDYCEGWFPRGRNEAAVLDGLKTLDELAAEAGRDRSTISVSLFAAAPDPDTLAKYEEAGVDLCILWVPPDGAEDVLPRLDRYARLL